MEHSLQRVLSEMQGKLFEMSGELGYDSVMIIKSLTEKFFIGQGMFTGNGIFTQKSQANRFTNKQMRKP